MKRREASKKVNDGIVEAFVYRNFPSEHRPHIQTNAVIVGLNQEIRRRTHVADGFPDDTSALMLAYARLRYASE